MKDTDRFEDGWPLNDLKTLAVNLASGAIRYGGGKERAGSREPRLLPD